MVNPLAVSGGGSGFYNISDVQIQACELVVVIFVGKPKPLWGMVPVRCVQTVPFTSVQGTMSTMEQKNLPCWESWRACENGECGMSLGGMANMCCEGHEKNCDTWVVALCDGLLVGLYATTIIPSGAEIFNDDGPHFVL